MFGEQGLVPGLRFETEELFAIDCEPGLCTLHPDVRRRLQAPRIVQGSSLDADALPGSIRAMHDSSAAVGAKVTAFDATVFAWRIPAAHRFRTFDKFYVL